MQALKPFLRVFFRFLRPKMPLKAIRLLVSLRYLDDLSWVMSSEIDSTPLKVASFSRHFATVLRQDATLLRQDATLLRRDATFLRHSVKRRKSDLRQIAFRFLTARIRVGGIDYF